MNEDMDRQDIANAGAWVGELAWDVLTSSHGRALIMGLVAVWLLLVLMRRVTAHHRIVPPSDEIDPRMLPNKEAVKLMKMQADAEEMGYSVVFKRMPMPVSQPEEVKA